MHQPLDEFVEIAAHLIDVGYLVVVLVKIERVVERGCGKLHFQVAVEFVQIEHVRRVVVGDGDAETYILYAHAAQFEQRAQTLVETSAAPAQFVVLARKSLDADAETELRIFACECDDAVGEIAACGEYYAVGLGQQDFDYILYVFAHKRFATRNVYALHARQLVQQFGLELLLSFCRVVPNVSHLATHRTTVGNNYRSIHNLCYFNPMQSFRYFQFVFSTTMLTVTGKYTPSSMHNANPSQ